MLGIHCHSCGWNDTGPKRLTFLGRNDPPRTLAKTTQAETTWIRWAKYVYWEILQVANRHKWRSDQVEWRAQEPRSDLTMSKTTSSRSRQIRSCTFRISVLFELHVFGQFLHNEIKPISVRLPCIPCFLSFRTCTTRFQLFLFFLLFLFAVFNGHFSSLMKYLCPSQRLLSRFFSTGSLH